MRILLIGLIVVVNLLTGCQSDREDRYAKAEKYADDMVETYKKKNFTDNDEEFLKAFVPLLNNIHEQMNTVLSLNKDISADNVLNENSDWNMDMSIALSNLKSASIDLQSIRPYPDNSNLNLAYDKAMEITYKLNFVADNYLQAAKQMDENLANECVQNMKDALSLAEDMSNITNESNN